MMLLPYINDMIPEEHLVWVDKRKDQRLGSELLDSQYIFWGTNIQDPYVTIKVMILATLRWTTPHGRSKSTKKRRIAS